MQNKSCGCRWKTNICTPTLNHHQRRDGGRITSSPEKKLCVLVVPRYFHCSIEFVLKIKCCFFVTLQ